ncbi:MAG: fibro-slime domain-containing protein [Planctomycetota bacterium]|jgi:fibro-slime domain-containing protein
MAVALGAAAVLTPASPAQITPEEVVVAGVVRDFKNSHPDFAVTMPGGNAHAAGIVDVALNDHRRPEFTGNGFVVTTEWLDKDGLVIAPNQYIDDNPISLVSAPSISPLGTFDSYDSSVGPYGGSNVGPTPTVIVGATMPGIAVPADLAATPSEGSVTRSNQTISSNIHAHNLTLNGTVLIDGNVAFLCEGAFMMGTSATVDLLPDATLDIYVYGGVSINPHAALNGDSWDPRRVRIYSIGTEDVVVSQPLGVAHASVVAPQGGLVIMPGCHFFGRFIGQSLTVSPNGNLHADTSATYICGEAAGDLAGSGGMANNGGVSSAGTFNQWFRDSLGMNQSAAHSIVLTRDFGGIYEYLDNAFLPIDGQLFGNEGAANNHFFTYTIAASFTYESCTGQFVSFQGGDGTWIFINGELVIDQGGVMPPSEQTIHLDRLGLVDGRTYEMRLFYADRDDATAVFRLRTNLLLESQATSPTLLTVFD